MHNKTREECITKQRYTHQNMEKIPHIIHYCWFGRNPKSELVLNCIESWKKYLPGYEIREWNEDNYDVTQVNFVKEAYENQKWAFVSDYVRFDVLYQFGGIILIPMWNCSSQFRKKSWRNVRLPDLKVQN